MAEEGNLGRLFFTLGLDDKEFENKLKAIGKTVNKAFGGDISSEMISGLDKVEKKSTSVANKAIDMTKKQEMAETRLVDISMNAKRKMEEKDEIAHQKAMERAVEKRNRESAFYLSAFDNIKKQEMADAQLVEQAMNKRKALRDFEEKAHQRAVQRAKERREAEQSKSISGTIYEQASSIGKRSDPILAMKKYYEEEAKQAKNVANGRAMLDKQTQQLAKSQRGMGLSLLFSNGEMRSSIRLSSSLSNQMGTLFSVYAAERFLKALIDIRGEFELQQVALRAILRDTSGADRIFAQLQSLAVKSPFLFKDLVSYTKQLSAFSVPIEELFDTTKNLADISSGLGVDMSRIIIAYGQVKSAAVLRGQELRQFTEAGIPLVDELAKKFTQLNGELVTAGDVFDLISKRQVPFEMIKEIFEDMTSAGGMFYKMQEKQAETLKGRISNLVDVLHQSLNRMGEDMDSVLKSGVDLATYLAQNFEKVIKVLGTIIATLGIYKATQSLAFGAAAIGDIAKKIEAFRRLKKTMDAVTAAQKAMNIASAANITLAIAQAAIVVIGGLATAFQLFMKDARDVNDVIDDLSKSTNNLVQNDKNMTDLIDKYGELTKQIKDGKTNTDARTEAERKRNVVVSELNKLTGVAITKEDEYGKKLDINIEKVKKYSEEERNRAVTIAKMNMLEAKKSLSAKEKEAKQLYYSLNSPSGFQFKNILDLAKSKDKLHARDLDTYNALQADVDNLRNTISESEAIIEAVGKIEGQTGEVLAKWQTSLISKINKQFAGKIPADELGTLLPKFGEDAVEYAKRVAEARDEQVKLGETMANNAGFSREEVLAREKLAANYKLLASMAGVKAEKDKEASRTAKTQQDIWKEQLGNLEDLYSTYTKLRKETGSDTAATAKIGEMPQFKGMAIPKTSEEYVAALRTLLGNVSGDAADDVKKKISDAIAKGVQDGIDEAKKKFDEFKELFDFYEQLKDLTGNEKYAQRMAFGSGFTQEFFDKAKAENAAKRRNQFILDVEKTLQEQMTAEEKIQLAKDKQLATEEEIKNVWKERAEEAKRRIEATRKATEADIAEIKNQAFQLSPLYQQIFAEISDMSLSTLTNLTTRLDKIIASATYDKDTKQYTLNDGAKQWKITDSAFRGLIKRASEFKSKMKDFDPFKALFNPSGETFEDKAKSVEESLQDIAGIASSLVGVVKSLSDSLGLELEPEIEAASSALEGLFGAGSGVARIMAGDVAGGSVQLLQGVASIIDAMVKIDDISIDKEIKSINKNIDDLTYALERLNKEREKAVGLSDYETDKERVRNLQAQVDATNALIKQEEARRDKRLEEAKTWKTFAFTGGMGLALGISYLLKASANKSTETIDELLRTAQEKADELRDIFEEAVADAVGTSSDYATQLGDAIIDAFLAGEDAAQAWGNTVDEIVNNVTRKLMLEKYLTPAIDEIFKSYMPLWETNGAFDPSKFIATLPSFRSDLDSASKNMNLFFSALGKSGALAAGTSTETMTKSIQGLTEETGNKVVSYMNQVRADGSAKRKILETMAIHMANDGIPVFDNRANLQLIALNEKMEESNRNTAAIRGLLNDVIGVKGSPGKGVRII